jgi:hypothetical protein
VARAQLSRVGCGAADHGTLARRIPDAAGPGSVVSVEETARTRCIKCGRFLGAAMVLCAACMSATPSAVAATHHNVVIVGAADYAELDRYVPGLGTPAAVRHDGAAIIAADADRAEPPHVPELGAADIHEGTRRAASPPAAAAPFIQPRSSRGRPPQRRTGLSQGILVFVNPDGTRRIVYVRG